VVPAGGHDAAHRDGIEDLVCAVAVDASLAETLPVEDRAGLIVIPRRRHRRPWRSRPRRPIEYDEAVVLLARAPADTLVLVPSRTADPAGAALAPIARLVGLPVLTLPDPPDAAAWTLAVAARWAADGHERLADTVAVAVGLTAEDGPLPRRPWGREGLRLPAIRPRALWRWAALAWRPCEGCRSGGGLPGAACPTCGAALPRGARRGHAHRPVAGTAPAVRARPVVP
jgi:hypothetical protein